MRSKWKEYREIMDIIDNYYPKECDFGSKKYKQSKEYKRYKKIIDDKVSCKKMEHEYYELICSIFPQYYVWRWTGKVQRTYPSIHFSVLLHENQPILDDNIELIKVLGGRKFNLEIFISRISKFYYVYTNEDIYDENKTENAGWSFDSHSETFILKKKDLKQLYKKLEEKGLIRLNRKIAHMEVPFINTELLPVKEHKVEIFNCLFSDMEIDYY